MAMPSMSRPHNGSDMDLLKSLLTNGSSNSEDNQEAKEKSSSSSSSSPGSSKSRSRSGSPESERGRKTRSRSNSPPPNSPPAEKKSSSDIWADFDTETKPSEKGEPTPVNTTWSQKEKSDDEETQSYQYSSFSSASSDDTDDTKTKKSTTKRKKKKKKASNAVPSKVPKDSKKKKFQKKSGKNKLSNEKTDKEMENKALKNDSDNDTEDASKETTARYEADDSCVRIDMKYRVPEADEKSDETIINKGEFTRMQKFYQNRKRNEKHRKQHDLTEKARQTLHLYPDTLSGPESHRLAQNYRDLQGLLQDQFIDDHDEMNKEIVAETKQALMEFKQYNEGHIGSMKPPGGRPTSASRRPILWRAHRVPASAQTQTDLEDADRRLNGHNRRNRPYSANGYYLIDATTPETKKHVTFVRENEALPQTISDDEGPKRQPNIYRGSSIPRSRGRTRPQKITVKPTANPKQKEGITRPASGRKQDDRSASDSSSRSRSRSRSRSTDRKTDHQLKATSDPKIKDWLKQKNKLLRAQHKEERRKEREKRKEEAEKIKQQAKREEDSEKAVNKWKREKHKEAGINRLLKKRATERDSAEERIVKGMESTATTEETVELNGSQAAAKNHKSGDACSAEIIQTDAKGEEILKCTCGYVDIAKSKEEEEKQTRRAMKLRMEREAARRGDLGPKPPGSKQSSSNRGKISVKPTTTQRMTYDDWVKIKKTEDFEKRKQEKKRQEHISAQSDPENEEVVSNMAKKRIDNIMERKTRIDTGISSVDAEANRSMDEKVSSKKGNYQHEEGKAVEVQPASGSSARFYRWDASNTEPADNQPKRPVSAPVEPVFQSKNQPKRPASAKKQPAISERKKSDPSRSPKDSLETKRSRSASPKPKMKKTDAYSKVKYQRRSWDEFSDYVWDKLNEGDGEIIVAEGGEKTKIERPEPQGADSSQPVTSETEHAVQMTVVQGSIFQTEVNGESDKPNNTESEDNPQNDSEKLIENQEASTKEDAVNDSDVKTAAHNTTASDDIAEQREDSQNENSPVDANLQTDSDQEDVLRKNNEDDAPETIEPSESSPSDHHQVSDGVKEAQTEDPDETSPEEASASPKTSPRKVRFAETVVTIDDAQTMPSDVPPASDYDLDTTPGESATNSEEVKDDDIISTETPELTEASSEGEVEPAHKADGDQDGNEERSVTPPLMRMC